MRTSIVLLCLLLASYSYAQDKLPAFGKIDKAELQVTTCSYDPNAEAEWLINTGEVTYNLNSTVYIQTDYRCRIKILDQKGIDEANVKITYQSKNNYEDITNIDGYVYNLSDAGEVITSKLENKQIFTKKVDENFSQVSFALPNVKPGSVVEYRFRSYKHSIEDIEDWYFQKEVPVRYSAYNLVIPEYFDFSYKVTRRQDMEVKKNETDPTKGSWFIMRNIPGLKEEPYASGIKDYVQRVDFQLSVIRPPGRDPISFTTSWQKLNEEMLEKEVFAGQLGKNIPGTDGLQAKVKAATSEKEKISLIYQFVQKNMEWNGRHSFYSVNGVKQAWDKKSGNTGDINLLLVNLLKEAGLRAVPILVSTKDNGKVNTYYPFLYQFNEVMAAVMCKDSSIYVMDACDKYNCYNRVPYDVQQTEGLVIDRKGPQFLYLSDRSALRHNISVQLRLGDDGKLEGEAVMTSADYGRNIQLNKYRHGKLKEAFSVSDGVIINADSIQVENDEKDTEPLAQHAWLSGELQPSGGYAFIPYHLFTGMSKNPFTAEKRQTDIDFSYPRNYTITGSIILPDTYTFDDLPKNVKMIMADTSIILTRILQKDDNILSYRMTLQFERPNYAADEYPDVKEFFKKLYAALDEKIVVKKKS